MKTLFETEQPSNNLLTLICPCFKTSTGKSDVKRKRWSCHVLTSSPEKQELEKDIAKAYWKLPKKKEKTLSFPIKRLSKGDLDSKDR